MLPSYQNPITISPSLSTQLANHYTLLHKQQIIHDAVLNTSNKLWIEPYRCNHTTTPGYDKVVSSKREYIMMISSE